MFFSNVFRRSSKRNEPLKYEVVNRDVEMKDCLVDSLLRSKMAKIKVTDKGRDLYYNI